MSSTGYKGGASRCFYEWQNFMACYTAESTSELKDCRPLAEDYTECLHHVKEKKRAQLISTEYARKVAKDTEVPEIKRLGHSSLSLEDLGLLK